MTTDAPSYLQLAFNSLAAIGACTGLAALFINLSDRRVRLRVQLGFSDSLAANGFCITYAIFNDGQDVLLDGIGVESKGEIPVEVDQALSERMRTAPRPTESDRRVIKLVRGDKFEGQIPWPWGVFLRTKTPFDFTVGLRNGWKWNIPCKYIATTKFSGFVVQQPFLFPFGMPQLKGQAAKARPRR